MVAKLFAVIRFVCVMFGGWFLMVGLILLTDSEAKPTEMKSIIWAMVAIGSILLYLGFRTNIKTYLKKRRNIAEERAIRIAEDRKIDEILSKYRNNNKSNLTQRSHSESEYGEIAVIVVLIALGLLSFCSPGPHYGRGTDHLMVD